MKPINTKSEFYHGLLVVSVLWVSREPCAGATGGKGVDMQLTPRVSKRFLLPKADDARDTVELIALISTVVAVVTSILVTILAIFATTTSSKDA